MTDVRCDLAQQQQVALQLLGVLQLTNTFS